MNDSLLSKFSFATKAGLAIFALVAIPVGILANIHSVKTLPKAVYVYPLCTVFENAREFKKQNLTLTGTLYSYTQGIFYLGDKSCNGLTEDRLRVVLAKDLVPSEDMQKLVDELHSFAMLNEYKTVDVKITGLFRGRGEGPFVATDIQPINAVSSKYFPEEICLIHNQIFEKNFLSLRYTIFEQNRKFHREFLKAKISLFPNSQLIRDVGRGGCGLEFEDHSPEVSYCRMCKDAELKWVKDHASASVSF
jgi:hypothetical protein